MSGKPSGRAETRETFFFWGVAGDLGREVLCIPRIDKSRWVDGPGSTEMV
jgi:hypothetical protein